MTDNRKPAEETKDPVALHAKMHYVLRGFHHEAGSRVFTFDGVSSDSSRTVFTVQADLTLTRNYGIPLQDLPLLCRVLLDESSAGGSHVLVYTEQNMRAHALRRAELRDAAAQKKRPPKRTPVENVGLAWRRPPMPV